MSVSRFVRAYPPAAPPLDAAAIWLLFRNDELLVQGDQARLGFPRGDAAAGLGSGDEPPLFLGTLDGVPCFACEVADAAQLADGAWRSLGLRALFGQVDDAEYGLAGYAAQLLHWRRISRFCSVCGQPTVAEENTWGRRCIGCGHTTYPHVSPAVLVLVHDEAGRILLARKPGWGRRYSILAGFVEPGESLEECARREVYEEVGVLLDEPIYVGSQPWPFPHQIMVGFTARWAGGDIRIDTSELDTAAWFDAHALPDLPPPLSLSRQMIDAWREAQSGV